MHRYFDSNAQLAENYVGALDEDESRHAIKSMRQRAGDAIRVFDAHSAEYVCVIESIDDDRVTYRAENAIESETDSYVRPVLGMALAKMDKFELVCQKATELGVGEIAPFYSRHCVATVTRGKREDGKHERRLSIIYSAVKQCGRRVIPRLELPVSLDTLLQRYQPPDYAPRLIACENSERRNPLLSGRLFRWQPKNEHRPVILIGPEGGWDAEEIDQARSTGWEPVSLGSRTLRCETAALAALTTIMVCAGEM